MKADKDANLHAMLAGMLSAAIPSVPPGPVEFAEANVRLVGSARSERFDPSITPWTREPLERIADIGCRRITFVKPVQSGGSVVGEIAACYWISHGGGMIHWNWENDKKASSRWESRIFPILQACHGINWPADRFKIRKCEVAFASVYLKAQGALVPDNLDSDSVRYEINEEIHNWEPGHLQKAYNRTTAFWYSWILNISNASRKGDQLHQAFLSGTRQQWEVRCPGCGEFHPMHTRYDSRRPELGGLRYDADGCRLADGGYDYNKLAPTVRYQFPCGFEVKDDQQARRSLSLSGRYSQPMNAGASLTERSYTLEAVSVDYIPWLKLIQEKHQALRARKWGDPEPWQRYICERECGFYDPEDVPISRVIKTTDTLKKSREGMAGRAIRFFAVDRQRGVAKDGEHPHWWLVIRDADASGNSLLVYEGKLLTDEDLIAVLKDHNCNPRHGVIDSGWDSTHVYQFCYRNDIDAIKGEGNLFFAHDDDERHIYSPTDKRSVADCLSWPLKYPVVELDTENVMDIREPKFWLYSKSGIRDRLAWIRASTARRWDVPGDVSEDYRSHMESEEPVKRRHAKTGEIYSEWVQLRERNDLFVCECYIAMLMEIAGLTSPPDEQQEQKGQP